MTTVAVIPIKQLENAKQRLSGVLSPAQRAGLLQAMVEDVLEAVTSCDRIDEVVIVTSDQQVAELGRRYSARILPEPQAPGLIAAVTLAGRVLNDEGVEVMMFLPGDVPLVTLEELDVVLDGFGRQGCAEFAIVPASDLGGSNCVVCSPPDCMTFGFGEDSFRRHLRLARSAGITPMVARLPGLGLDVDTPEDLRTLATMLEKHQLKTHTGDFLQANGIGVEVRAMDASQ